VTPDGDHVGIDVDALRPAPGAVRSIEPHEAATAADVEDYVVGPDQVGQAVAIEALLRAAFPIDAQDPQRLVRIPVEVRIVGVIAALALQLPLDAPVQFRKPDHEGVEFLIDQVVLDPAHLPATSHHQLHAPFVEAVTPGDARAPATMQHCLVNPDE